MDIELHIWVGGDLRNFLLQVVQKKVCLDQDAKLQVTVQCVDVDSMRFEIKSQNANDCLWAICLSPPRDTTWGIQEADL
jgi:hypothetical protein